MPWHKEEPQRLGAAFLPAAGRAPPRAVPCRHAGNRQIPVFSGLRTRVWDAQGQVTLPPAPLTEGVWSAMGAPFRVCAIGQWTWKTGSRGALGGAAVRSVPSGVLRAADLCREETSGALCRLWSPAGTSEALPKIFVPVKPVLNSHRSPCQCFLVSAVPCRAEEGSGTAWSSLSLGAVKWFVAPAAS